MKNKILCAAMLLLAACGTVEQPDAPAVEESQRETGVFRGIIAEEESRVYLDDKVRLLWNEGDLITLFEGLTRNKKYKFMGEDGDNAGEFEFMSQGFGTGNDLDRYLALYPYASTTKYVYGQNGAPDYIQYTLPSTQTYAAGSVGKGANVMVAVTADLDDFDLLFRNTCSFLQVRLWGADAQTIKSVTVTTLGGEPIAGKCAIVPTYGGTPTLNMLGTTSTVTLGCGNGVTIGTSADAATDFWVVLPAGTYASGIRVTVNGYYGGSQNYDVTSSVSFARNKYKRLTREVTFTESGTGMGVGGWEEGSDDSGVAE